MLGSGIAKLYFRDQDFVLFTKTTIDVVRNGIGKIAALHIRIKIIEEYVITRPPPPPSHHHHDHHYPSLSCSIPGNQSRSLLHWLHFANCVISENSSTSMFKRTLYSSSIACSKNLRSMTEGVVLDCDSWVTLVNV